LACYNVTEDWLHRTDQAHLRRAMPTAVKGQAVKQHRPRLAEEDRKRLHQFARECSEVMGLAFRIEREAGLAVEVRPAKRAGWGFYAPKNFAYARRIESRQCLRVSTKEEWAVNASVDQSGHGTSPKGWWGEPSVWWDMHRDDVEGRERLAGILARVCEARHSSESAQPGGSGE